MNPDTILNASGAIIGGATYTHTLSVRDTVTTGIGGLNSGGPISCSRLTVNGSISGSRLIIGGNIKGNSISGSNITSNIDIVSFVSDSRLTTNIEPIENALDKILALNGFTYNFNEIGEDLGFDTSIRHSGVSAQEVQ